MGNKQSSVIDQSFEAFSQNYVYVKKCNDSRFGEVKWLQDKATGAKVIQRDYVSNTVKDYEKYLNEVKRRASVSHPNILRIMGYTTKREDAFCADYYKISAFFEAFDFDLEQDLHKKMRDKVTILSIV